MKKVLILITLTALLFGCRGGNSGGSKTGPAKTVSIGIFIPGVMSGSPLYEMLALGVQRAAAENTGVETTIIEGGYNQAEWESRVTSMAASGDYDLIVSSNPSLPAIASEVSAKFPKQHFLLLDGELSGNPAIYTMRYNQWEQAYMAGHIAALVTKAAGQGQTRIGLVAAQEYPAMNDIILPGYREGAQAVDPAFTVDFRVVGNWFDAERGAQLAEEMIRNGAPVILPIAGGAGAGVLQAASEAGAKVVWFDINGYDLHPGTVVGSAVLHQNRAAYEQTKRYLEGRLPFGSAEMVGVADGYVDFIEDDPHYIAAVSGELREKQTLLVEQIRSGVLVLGK
ncbi:BMP family ABC transporter substrate-binding protein [Treponema primitia]|uniref:BMP family ABC transporter substrate-binding protein n=1 Tax=Treponema primitia TaxID=88058 RepID=UPI00025553D5|nr:BMP family ABC transporter substrate-binding protein [Treponema primitia]